MGETIAITAGRLLSGEDLVGAHDVSVVVSDGAIQSIGPASQPPTPGSAVVDARDLTLMPGFIDAHVHIALADPADVLLRGVTTARDLAWPEDEIFDLAAGSRRADFLGPTILAAGPMLTAPGGYPTGAGWAPRGTGLEVTSLDAARREVARLSARGAAIVKVALNPPAGPTLEAATLAAIVEEAHANALKVTGHVHGLGELTKALDAGMDELAHMPMAPERVPDELIARMAAAMTIVPTLSIFLRRARRIAIDNLARFHAAGGRVVYGTDLGNSGPKPGIDRREIKGMARAGMSGREIVASGTSDAAAWLGLEDVGTVQTGKLADLVAVQGDPFVDPLALTKIRMVFRRGRRVR